MHDITVIDSIYNLHVNSETQKVINSLKELITKDDLVIEEITLINVYVVLSTAYQFEGEWEKQKQS